MQQPWNPMLKPESFFRSIVTIQNALKLKLPFFSLQLVLITGMIILYPFQSLSQDTLTLQEAIQQGLAENYQIRIARKNRLIKQNNVSRGNAGFLPTLRLTANQSTDISNTSQDFISGESVNRSGAQTDNLNTRADLRWTLFDGFRMFTTYNKLEAIRNQGETEFREAVQEQVSAIIDQYYRLVKLKQALNTQLEALKLTRKRLSLAKTRMNIGAGSELAYRQVQSDYNADTANYLRERQALKNAKTRLNKLMGVELPNQFKVPAQIPLQKPFQYQELKQKAFKDNPRLQTASKNKRIARLELEEIKGNHYPEIGLNLGYEFSETSSEAGFLRESQEHGFDYGLFLNYDLFQGFNNKRKAENARIQIDRSQLELEQEKNAILTDLKQAFTTYQESRSRVKLEKDNVSVANETFRIARNNYQSGGIDYLQLKQAQQDYLETKQRLTNARYQTKQAEIQLMRLSGMLLGRVQQ